MDKTSPFIHFLLSPWANFDGIYYLFIAASGYTVDNSGFFPLLPLIIKALIFPFGNLQPLDTQEFFIAFVLVSVIAYFAIYFFYKLVKLDYPQNIAKWSVAFLLVFPTSFYLASIYSEGLFLLLLFISFYFARKKNWVLSAIAGALLTATRFVGVGIFPALLFEFWVLEKTFFSKKIFPLFLVPAGLISYMWYNFINWGNPLLFIEAQGNLANSRSVDQVIFPLQTVFRYFKILFQFPANQYEWWIALLELSIFIFVSILLFIAWKKKVRTSYLIFSVFVFLVPTLTGTLTALPRYVLPIFPVFIALTLVENKILKAIYLTVGIILLFILFALFSKGYFVA